jgi:hypothetical protein
MKPMHKIIFVVVLSLALANCKKTLQVSFPPPELPDTKVLGNDSSTLDVVTSVYISMSGPGPIDGPNSMYLELGLAADELDEYYSDADLLAIYTDNFSPGQDYFWNYLYTQIYACNAVINSQPAAQVATASSLRRQAIGEAAFLRAFLLFYATTLYGEIPLPTTTDYRINNVLSRNPQTVVYAQIINDLTTASRLLGADYLDGRGRSTSDRVRPNKWAAMALLARANLYAGNWADAEAAADSVIAAGAQYTLPTDLNQVFLVNSPEAIWQIPPVLQSVNTYAAFIFFLDKAPDFQHPVAMSPFLLNTFEPGDLRLSKWVGQSNVPTTDSTRGVIYHYPYKYKVSFSTPAQEYLMVMRLGEQYLIRAETRARQGDLIGAAADLNQLRNRAGLPGTGAATQSQLLTAVAHERQVELFTECGDRWLDLKRTKSLDSVMQVVTPHKGGVWHSYDSLLPIPITEIHINPHLTQNPGY